MQFESDWNICFNKTSTIERELKGFKFKGPGIYLSDTDTLLIIPIISSKEITGTTIWDKEWPKDTDFICYVWNTQVKNLIFYWLLNAPVIII